MKVGIITFHFVPNQGALLQCYALQTLLERMGHEAYVIHYTPPYHTVRYATIKNPLRYANWFTGKYPDKTNFQKSKIFLNAFARASYSSIFSKDKDVNAAFDRFIGNTFHLTSKYTSYDQLVKNPPKLDAYISGSDQLWNPSILNHTFDPAYFLKFGGKEITKLTYAVSLGQKISDEQALEVKELCAELSFISLREKSDEIENTLNRDVAVCIDPTLNLDQQDYAPIEEEIEVPDEYIFVYGFETNDAIKLAVNLAMKKYKCVIVNGSPHRIKLEDKAQLLSAYSPGQFLTLIKNAKCVVTNSFHGTALSIVYKKEFVTVSHSTRGGRMESLLTMLGLTARLWGSPNYSINSKIDYENVYKILKERRKFAKTYLETALTNDNEIYTRLVRDEKKLMEELKIVSSTSEDSCMDSVPENRFIQKKSFVMKGGKKGLYTGKETCCGCSACFSACPVQAITMVPDNEGFLYPEIDEMKCIECKKCLSVCAFQEDCFEMDTAPDMGG